MRILVRGRMIREPGLPFPAPSTEVRFFDELGILVEPGSPRDVFRVAYALAERDVRLLLVTHPHLDHLANAIAFPEAELVRNPRRDGYSEGSRRYKIRNAIRSIVRLRPVSPSGREEIDDDVLARQTDLHFPGHLVFLVRGVAFVGDSFPPRDEIEERAKSGERFRGRLAEHMRDVAERSELIVTAHRGHYKPDEILSVVRFF